MAQSKSLFFEDFKPGQEFVSRGRTITESESMQCVNLAWYINPRCTDAEFVKKGYVWNGIELHERIAPPPTGTFLAPGLKHSLGILIDTELAVLGTTWKAPSVIRFGDTIHLRLLVENTMPAQREDAGIVVFHMEVVNQRGEVVNKDTQTSLIARRSVSKSQARRMGFATIQDQNTHWENPNTASGARPQANLPEQYFEDFQTGQAFDTRWRTVTEADVSGLISLTWDHHPLYTDDEYARRAGLKSRIAPPLLGIVFAVGLDAPLAMAAGTCLGFTHTDWQFVGPIYVGDTLQLRQTIGAKTNEKEGSGIVAIDMQVVNQRGGVSIQGTRYMLVRRKVAEPAAAKLMAWH
jgi:acyl dehydratase